MASCALFCLESIQDAQFLCCWLSLQVFLQLPLLRPALLLLRLRREVPAEPEWEDAVPRVPGLHHRGGLHLRFPRGGGLPPDSVHQEGASSFLPVPAGRAWVFGRKARTESAAPSLSGNHRQHGDVGRQDCPRGACADPKVSDPEVSRAGAVPGVPWAGLLALLLQARGRAAGAPATSYLRLESGTGPRGPSQSRCRLDFCTGFWPQWV